MAVAFYLPAHHRPKADELAAWRQATHVTLKEPGKTSTAQNWIFKTWNALTLDGLEVDLVEQMPGEGIVVCLAGTLHQGFRAPPACYVAAVVSDGVPHPGAQLQILQNKHHAGKLRGSVFMPHWPQTNLIPRDQQRGDKFHRVGFLGDPRNLAPELADPAWAADLRERLGLEFVVRGHHAWHDYSDLDAVVAVRNFSRQRHLQKPATKLYNAWLAGVPFIAGGDSAYAAEGRPGEDYLTVRSPAELFTRLRDLQGSISLRNALVEAGSKRAKHCTPAVQLERWRRFVATELPERAAAWQRKPAWSRRMETLRRRALFAFDRLCLD
jgi:hypothetical protein